MELFIPVEKVNRRTVYELIQPAKARKTLDNLRRICSY